MSSLTALLGDEFLLFSLVITGYFALFNTIQLVLLLVAFRKVRQRVRAIRLEDFREIQESDLAPPVSVVVPAHNEGPTIVETIRSLLALRYVRLEIVVVNDGSTDDTLALLIGEFGLRRTPRVYWQQLKCKPVRGIYWSPACPRLWVLDKENGRKADAINAGINLASAPYVTVIDGDTIIEDDAVLAMMHAILPHSRDTVAAGGTVRIANGCRLEGTRAVQVGVPSSFLARAQIVEYLRGFLFGRVGWSELQSLMIVSGAFGIFRKDVLVEIGGFRRDTVGEDIDVIVRMHRQRREAGRPCRVSFVPDPVCWTECPETLGQLRSQRERWHRGLGETLEHNRAMLGNPRYGRIGLVAMPYYMLFEYLAPLVETAGFVILPFGWALGLVDWRLFLLFLIASVIYGLVLSLLGLVLEELSFRRYRDLAQLAKLVMAAVLEGVGLRQLQVWWRLVALITWRGRAASWVNIPRKGFQRT
ncbi:MAG TPA: glycosyltransferase [Gemmatimonadales bacterium]|nr:glycosyltransferase [Gemmatimonadales bacterium]